MQGNCIPDLSYYDYYYQNNTNYVNAYHNLLYYNQCIKNTPSIYDNNDLLTIDNTDAMQREMRLLEARDAAIINQLRMGCLTLYTDTPWTRNYHCNCDGNPLLTVQHMLLECPLLVDEQTNTRKLIESKDEWYIDDSHYTVRHLLFPHLHYKIKDLKIFENTTKRVSVLMIIAQYCRYRFPD